MRRNGRSVTPDIGARMTGSSSVSASRQMLKICSIQQSAENLGSYSNAKIVALQHRPEALQSFSMTNIYAVIVAAGRGSRFGGVLPKQYLALGGATVLRHAVAAFAAHPGVAGVQVVIRDEDRALFESAIAGLAVLPPIPGGAERHDSVRLGLEA